VELVVNLRDDEIRGYHPSDPGRRRRLSGAIIAGPQGGYVEMDPSPHASVVGVHFRPGGAFPFLGVPAGELADTAVDLDALWGRVAVELRERLCEAATPAERFALLERALAARLDGPPERHGAVPVALDAFGQSRPGVRIRDVARRVGLSQRRFIQVFVAEVGLTPKLYSRVQRFQRARASVRMTPAPDWAQVAVACGYFDQSHLIRDFRSFAGLTPEEYLSPRSEHVLHNHVPQAG
jgi:AraC-like DNA-binding protein